MICVKDLIKKYGKEKILDNLNLEINTCNVTSMIAPNGSGKSTFMKLLIGALFSDSGEITHQNKNESVSYLSEKEVYPEYFTTKEILLMEGMIFGLSEKEIWNIKAVMEFDLKSFENKKCKNLSKGMYRKLGIAKAMIGDPDFLIMDEPFEGLDSIAREKLINLIKDRKKKNKGTLLTSHILYEMENFCNDVIFIKNGNVKLIIKPQDIDYRIILKENKNSPSHGEYLFNEYGIIIYTDERYKMISHKNHKMLTENIVNEIYRKIYG